MSPMAKGPFLQIITENPSVKHFRVLDSDFDNPSKWVLESLEVELLSTEDTWNDYFIMKALHINPEKKVSECYIDMNFPERIFDYAFYVSSNVLFYDYNYKFPGDIIPAIALDCFGLYEQFYSKLLPELGIDVLKRGLAISKRKHIIAEDLGYILRDEKRYKESAEMFQIAVDEGPSSYFIYGELAGAYAELGDTENEKKYMEIFNREGMKPLT